MGGFSCDVFIKLNNLICSEEEVLDKVQDIDGFKSIINNNDGYENVIDYSGAEFIETEQRFEFDKKNKDDNDKELKKLKGLKGKKGIYFLLSDDCKSVLYIGKDKDLKKRLKDHLWSCHEKTNSKIKEVNEYINKLVDRKIRYRVIFTDGKYNAAIEEVLINYVKSNSTKFQENWNLRED